MTSLGREVAGGAAWMVGLRLVQRSLGLVSTIILARLLLPDDFGVVAMALSVTALAELISQLGFDMALIRTRDANRDHYDTAWTLGILFKAIAALAVATSALPVSNFYGDARLVGVLYAFAGMILAGGFENIGIIAFRKDLDFHKEFLFQFVKKLLSVLSTAAFAIHLGSYWALVIGSVTGVIIGVALSYAMHPYRPRLTLLLWRDMLGFSSWIFFNNLAQYARDRGPDFLIGRFLGATPLGTYRVAGDIASLPTTELYMPIMRAVFPGFSKIAGDPVRLRRAYLTAQAAVTSVAFPAGVAVILLAEPIVWALLGSKWKAAIPLIQILGIYGITKLLQGSRHSLMLALGTPYWVGLMVCFEMLVMYPVLVIGLLNGGGVMAAAWGRVAASVAALPVGVSFVSRVLNMRQRDFVMVVWRPVVATFFMGVVIAAVQVTAGPVGGTLHAVLLLLTASAIGGAAYGTALLCLWVLAGRPDGIEIQVLQTNFAERFVHARLLSWIRGQGRVV